MEIISYVRAVVFIILILDVFIYIFKSEWYNFT